MCRTKEKEMNSLEQKTNKTRVELEAMYLSAIDTLVNFGCEESEAREIARLSFRESLGLKA